MKSRLLLALFSCLVLILAACTPGTDGDMTDAAEGDTMMEGEMADGEMMDEDMADGEDMTDDAMAEGEMMDDAEMVEGEEMMDEEMAEGEMMDDADGEMMDEMDGDMAEGEDMAEEAMEPNIIEVAQEAGNFTILVDALQISGLDQTLVGEGPFTVFAPTDDAFTAFLSEMGMSAEELLTSPDLQSILLYHVVPGEVMADSVMTMTSGTTVQGADISIAASDTGVMLNDSVNVVQTDIPASNGVIHVIDSVLVPPM